MTEDIVGNDVATRIASDLRSSRRLQLGRGAFVTVHRTIGFFLGAVVVVVGLSGSILAFRFPIDEWLNASLMHVEIPAQAVYRPLDEILAAAKSAMPPNGIVERLRMPRHSGLATAVTYMVETDDLDTYFYEIFVDPYTANVKGQRIYLHGDDQFSQPLIRIIVAFHWTLLLGFNNSYILGIVGIIVFISILVGLYLWWPRNGNWRQGLTIKWSGSHERLAYDVHRSFGIYFAAILLVMLFTGVAMIFKPEVRSVVSLFSQVRPEPEFGKSTPIPDRPPLGLDAVAAIASKVFPDGKLRWILLPSRLDSVYVVGKRADDEPNRTQTFRNVGIDQYSGHVLHVQDRNAFTAGEKFLEWQFPLHCGEAFGDIARPFTMLIGFVPLILYVTGFLRWRQKRRARR